MKLRRLLSSAALVALTTLGVTLEARAQPQVCTISFDNTFALDNYYDDAQNQFANISRFRGTSGVIEPCCDPYTSIQADNCTYRANQWQTCWAYRQRCGSSTFYVNYFPWSLYGENASHHHAPFENPKLQDPLCTCGGGYGFQSGALYSSATCNRTTCPVWKKEPRSVFSIGHTSAHWTRIFVDKSGSGMRKFRMRDIIIGDSETAQLWFELADGTWWRADLPDGWHTLPREFVMTSAYLSNTVNSGPPANVVWFTIETVP